MNLPEMGAVGLAVITNIQPCPAIEQATGEVVTATFAHPPTHQVLDVSFEGEAKPIGVTCNHPFWSADRQCFLPIGEMAVGDRVITYAGATKRIESLLPRPGPETVFNLEVYGEHVYYVGGQGLLVHNVYPKGATKTGLPSQLHHYATNKSKRYTPAMKDIADRYGLDLDGVWNKELLPHLGRHPNAYHEFVLLGMKQAAGEAGRNKAKFLELFEEYVRKPVRVNPDLLRKIGWT